MQQNRFAPQYPRLPSQIGCIKALGPNFTPSIRHRLFKIPETLLKMPQRQMRHQPYWNEWFRSIRLNLAALL